MLQPTSILNKNVVYLAQADVWAVLIVIPARNVNLASLLASPHRYVYKLVEMEEDLHFHVMMETIIMEMAALLTVGCRLVGLVQEAHQTQEIHALKQFLGY